MAFTNNEIVIRTSTLTDLGAVVLIENRCFEDPWTPASLLGELVPKALAILFPEKVSAWLAGLDHGEVQGSA